MRGGGGVRTLEGIADPSVLFGVLRGELEWAGARLEGTGRCWEYFIRER